MKSYRTIILLAVLSLTFVSTGVYATTTVDDVEKLSRSELEDLVESLREEVTDLKSELRTLKADQLGYVRFTQELRRGDRSTEVQVLQKLLASDPVLAAQIGTVDGIFGQKTENALKTLQSKYKLEAKGYLSPETMELINAILEAQGVEGSIPPGLLGNPGLQNRVKVKIKNENGKFEYEIEVEDEGASEDDSDNDNDNEEDEDEDEEDDEDSEDDEEDESEDEDASDDDNEDESEEEDD